MSAPLKHRLGRSLTVARALFHLSLISLRQRFIYRTSTVLLFVATLVEIAALVFFWRVAQGQGADEALLGTQGIVGYIILAGLLGAANIGFGDQQMGTMVRSGEVIRHFLQPLDIQATMLMRQLGGWAGAVIITTIPVLLLANVVLGMPRPESTLALCAFVFSWIVGAVTISAFDYCVGLLTFRTIQDFFISQAKVAIVAFFSGALIPLDYLPGAVKTVAEMLPFQQAVYVPVSIYLGIIPAEAIPAALAGQLLWLLSLILLGRLAWHWAVQDVALHAT